MPDFPGRYPATRLRRFRMQNWSRRLRAESALRSADFVLPLFIVDGRGVPEPIPSLPGVSRLPIDLAVETAKEASALGIPGVALFPVVDACLKSEDGREALNPENLVCRAIKAIKQGVPDIGIIADVALDPYTTHGHDGLLRGNTIVNDDTVAVLTRQAVVLAEAGCDIVAPSDMMDGRIGAIRNALEDSNLPDVMILSYAVKYASALYGPFRDAVGSKGALSGASKASYQMDPANAVEAFAEAELDLAEGADAVMVKPALAYLDIVSALHSRFAAPIFAYHVSGEYAMVKAAAAAGVLDGDKVMTEHLLSIKRAGATAILTYAAMDIARSLKGEG
jgi:porphobilinogen synthase